MRQFKIVRRSEAALDAGAPMGANAMPASISRAEVVLRPLDDAGQPIASLSDSTLYLASLDGVPALNEIITLPF